MTTNPTPKDGGLLPWADSFKDEYGDEREDLIRELAAEVRRLQAPQPTVGAVSAEVEKAATDLLRSAASGKPDVIGRGNMIVSQDKVEALRAALQRLAPAAPSQFMHQPGCPAMLRNAPCLCDTPEPPDSDKEKQK